jgi:phosphate-selective porin OprO/OprP
MNKIAISILSKSLILIPCTTLAAQFIVNKNVLKYEELNFKVGGIVKIDEVLFGASTKDKKSNFYSGANIRQLALNVSGNLNKKTSYNMSFDFNTCKNSVEVDEVYINFEPWNKVIFSIGQFYPSYGLENTFSGKWLFFLERSLPSVAFATPKGIGVKVNKFNDNYSLTASFTQPSANHGPVDINGNPISRNDRWIASARGVYSWHFGEGQISQLGASGQIHDDHNAAIRIHTIPEVKVRNMNEILDTGRFVAKNHRTFGLEAAQQWGPFLIKAEWLKLLAKRSNGQSSVNFSGYYVQAAYVLTGEERVFNSNTGTFGQVIPSRKTGAWEVSTRYSFVNLNKNDIRGGAAHNIGGGLNYYVNKYIKISGQYIFSHQHLGSPGSTISKVASQAFNLKNRNLSIYALRIQFVF